MKLAAFSAGRREGNTEVFVKAALMAAEEMGVEVEYYRLNEFEMHNCTACVPEFCPTNRDINACPHKDDTPFLVDRFLDSDGVIIASPVYSLTPNSLLFTFRDRVFGPKMDVANVLAGRKEGNFVKGRFKARPGGLISVGGALTENWTSLGLPSLYTATLSAQTEIVDQMNIYGVADHAEAAIRDDLLERARQLGRHVAQAMLDGDHSWRGDEGTCPLCHLNLLQVIPGTDKVLCPVCGIYGHIRVEDGVTKVDWPDTPEYRVDNRLSIPGKQHHLEEITYHESQYRPHIPEAKERLKKFTAYNACMVKSPMKEAKRAQLREKLEKEKAQQEA